MANVALSDQINLYRLPPGRRLFALRRTHKLLAPADPLAKDIEKAMEHDRGVLDLLTRWQKARGESITWPKEAVELDREHDRLWGALGGACSSLAVGFGPSTDQGAAAARIQDRVFSAGVPALIHLSFVEQRENTDAWLARLQGELAADVQKIGLTPIVERLAVVNTRFGEVLDAHQGEAELRFDKVKQADDQGQRELVVIVATILGREARNDAERARLLGPIYAQHDELAEKYRQRAKVTDVDPESGKELDPVEA